MTDSSLEHPTARANGPGRLIRQARENAKLSVEDLAAVIKLSRHTVDALERDDFATLKEPVYVRGYYRKLSKMLSISEPELIAAYNAVAQPRLSAAPSKLILAGNQDLGGTSPWNKALVGVGIMVAALVIALAAFWATRRAELGDVPAVLPTPQAQPAAPPPAVIAPPPPAPASVAPEAVNTPPPEASATPAAPAAGDAQLSLEFSKESWAQIEDATGKRLAYSIMPAGEKLNLSGKPPFAVTLGRAAVVQMKFNGTPVDMSSLTLSSGKAIFSLP